MTKRIAVALGLGLAILIAAFLLLQPKTGSLEYHKRKYREAFHTGALAELIVNRGVNALDRAHWKFQRKRIEFHRQALIDAGFFEQKQFVFSNRPPREALRQVLSNAVSTFTNTADHFGCPVIREVTSNSITVVARAPVMRQFESFVSEADGEVNGR